MARRPPDYSCISPAFCTECGKQCNVIPLQNEFDYAGTHCTNGRGGTHYPPDWGSPVSDCCEADVREYNEDDPEEDR